MPQLITRNDVATIFKLARESGNTAAVHAAANGLQYTPPAHHQNEVSAAAGGFVSQAIPLPPGRLTDLNSTASPRSSYSGGPGSLIRQSLTGQQPAAGTSPARARVSSAGAVSSGAMRTSYSGNALSSLAAGGADGASPGSPFSAPSSAPSRGGVGYGQGPAVPRPNAQPRPDEIRFPDFMDVLARVALAAAVREQARTVPLAGATAAEVSAFGRQMALPEAEGALTKLLRHMGLERDNMIGLKQRLDALARMAGEKGARAKVRERGGRQGAGRVRGLYTV